MKSIIIEIIQILGLILSYKVLKDKDFTLRKILYIIALSIVIIYYIIKFTKGA